MLLQHVPPDVPPEVVQVSFAFLGTVIVIALGIPIIRALTRRWERAPVMQQPSMDVLARLDRIEQAVEAVAIEVERIAEAQRFAAKLAAEQQQKVLPSSDKIS